MPVLTSAEPALKPPVARKVPKSLTFHGDTRVDNYFWLREKSNPEVIQYLEAENRYTEAMMKGAEGLQQKLYQEMLGRIKQTDLSVPTRDGEFFYYSRTEEGKQYSIQCRRRGNMDAAEEVLLDQNEMAKGLKYFRLGGFATSPNHRLLAYMTDTAGDEMYTIYVKDLETGKLFADRVENAYYGLEWGGDNQTLFYVVLDAAKRPYKIFRHKLGVKQDELVYHEADEKFYLSLGKSRSRKYLFINSASFTTSEVRYLKADEPDKAFEVMAPRRQEIEYYAEHHYGPKGDVFYVRTNEGAKNFRLMRAPASDPSPKNWVEVIAHRPAVVLEDVDAFRDFLVVYEREQGLKKLRVRRLVDDGDHYVAFEEAAYALFPAGNLEFNTDLLRFSYTSLVTPSSVFDYDMRTKQRTLLKQQEVLGGYDPKQYATERLFATAPDGVKVPVAIVYRKGLKRDGRNPVWLYGYGSYGSNSEATFSSNRISLLDRGFVWAIANIRGGGELGEQWHDAGKLDHKKNTFTDFIACAEHLIEQKYTSKDRLVINGGSAGGLLMGAVVNMRPDLFKAVVAKVPFVDVLNTALDPTLPLTVGEYEEWGNSNEKKYYDYIKSYSPYDNVRAQAYPNMLITAGLNDPRVSYWEPAKWTARLRAAKTDGNLLMLKTNMGSGHFGASGRYDALKEAAFDYAFVLMVLGYHN